MRPRATVWLVLMVLVVALDVSAQTPRVVRQSGVVRDGAGQPRAGAATLTFGIYAEAEGGAPLWTEVQAVTLDSQGRYAVALGALAPEGLPLALFTGGAARWLGVAVDGEVELPRIALLSVPYAMKAADAETVAGKPLSAFVLAGDTTGTGADGLTYVNTKLLQGAAVGVTPLASSGSPGFLGVFTNSTDLGNSIMYQSGSSIGVNTTAPAAGFHAVATAAPGAFFDVYNNALGALPVVYRAARGTPGAPTAVQTDDILGGLAVRGYGATGFSGGQGQVMFRAAEPWTDAAHGTYLQLTTTPLGSASWVERMRITPAGNVGIGTTTPAQMLSVAGTVESTTGGFKFPDGTTQATALSLAANTFTATQTISGGNLVLPSTTSSSSGMIMLGGQNFVHAFGGIQNTYIGSQAGVSFSPAMGLLNVGVGFRALYANTTGALNTAVGGNSLKGTTTGYANSGFGSSALFANTTGIGNSAFGMQALFNSTANNNSAFGYQALLANTTGEGNTAVGNAALAAVTTTDDNTAVGFFSLSRTTSIGNTALGSNSLLADTTGGSNTAVGNQAVFTNTTGGYNTGVGAWALRHLSAGDYNTGLGVNAGYYLAGGGFNTFLGWMAHPDSTTPALQYSAAIGANAIVAQNNSLVLGGTGTYAVSVGIGTSTPDERLQVVGDIKIGTSGTNGCVKNFAGTGILGTCSSDLRLKANVRPFGPVLDRVARLRPVHFDWRAKDFPEYHFGTATNSGLIAQDVEQVFPEMVATDERGYKMVNYSELPYLTLAAVRELKAENDALRAQLAALADRLARLETRDRR
jgi:hypothetical protein